MAERAQNVLEIAGLAGRGGMLEHLVRDAVDLQPDTLENVSHAIDQGVEQPGQHGIAPGVRTGRRWQRLANSSNDCGSA